MNRGTVHIVAANEKAGTNCGALVVMMVIAEETDDAAFEKWEHYRNGMDMEALGWRQTQAAADPNTDKYAGAGRWAEKLRNRMPTAHGALIGSYEHVAAVIRRLRHRAGVAGRHMLTFDDFVAGMDKFGQRIQRL